MTMLGQSLLIHQEIPGSQTLERPHSLDRECLVRVGANDGFGGDGPMGKITGRESNRLTLSLVGNFRLGDPEGRAIRVTEKKARVPLAMLAIAVRLPRRAFGPVTASVLAAFAHIGGQLLLARLWLVPHDGVFLLAPVFGLSALVFGIVNGLIAAKLLKENQE